jgi:hypothetical protein
LTDCHQASNGLPDLVRQCLKIVTALDTARGLQTGCKAIGEDTLRSRETAALFQNHTA